MFTSDYAPVRITLVIQPNPPEPVEPEEGADTDGKPVEGSEEEPAAKPNDETPDETEDQQTAGESQNEPGVEPAGKPNPQHQYEAVVTDPTCTEQGYTTYNCPECGDSYVDDYTAALDHDWYEWVLADDEYIRTCRRCAASETSPVNTEGN